MKCASCGMPLSPNRPQTNCPKCGAPVNTHASQKVAIGASGNYAPGFPVPSAFNPSVQSPVAPQPPQQPPDNSRNIRLGFMVAGLCILAGAFLLMLVYFLGVGGQGNQTAGSQTTPQPTVVPSPSPAITPSPTATPFPGQQYIDNAQLSSSPPPAVQPTTTFTSGQKIYVTFDMHLNGQKGVICFVWYLNGQQATSYNFPVSGGNNSSYAYATLGGSGAGYVDLYWANDTTCNNDLLAQQVPFTLTK
jgi:hypothetical protein